MKPGATVLLSGTDERSASTQPVLAYQRYGRGKALAFPVQDSWHWQMHADIRVEDMTHENYWRQLLRWLVDGVPEHGRGAHHAPSASKPASRSRSPPTSSTTRSSRSTTRRSSRKVTTPTGGVIDVPMQWTGERNGQYRGTFVASDAGHVRRRVEAAREGKSLGAGVRRTLRAAPGDAEYFDATMHAARLQRIAEETGGRFYTPGDA